MSHYDTSRSDGPTSEQYQRLREMWLRDRDDAVRWRAFANAAVETITEPHVEPKLFEILEQICPDPKSLDEVNAAMDAALARIANDAT